MPSTRSSRAGLSTTAEFAEALLTEAHVAVTAGEGFDAPGFFRISYATSLDRLREGVTRIHEFVRKRETRGVGGRALTRPLTAPETT